MPVYLATDMLFTPFPIKPLNSLVLQVPWQTWSKKRNCWTLRPGTSALAIIRNHPNLDVFMPKGLALEDACATLLRCIRRSKKASAMWAPTPACPDTLCQRRNPGKGRHPLRHPGKPQKDAVFCGLADDVLTRNLSFCMLQIRGEMSNWYFHLSLFSFIIINYYLLLIIAIHCPNQNHHYHHVFSSLAREKWCAQFLA